jgi:hypothetical protein
MRLESRRFFVLLLVIFLAYALGRVISSLPAIADPRSLADTTAYLRISRQPLSDFEFWTGARPFVFPLLLKIARQSAPLTAVLQLGFSILAWGLLAWMTIQLVKIPWVKILAFCLLLAFSLDRHITGWDSVMMTESLSISFLVLFIAMSMWLLQRWHIGKAILLILAAFLLAFTRDTNAWMLLALAGVIVLTTLLRWTQPRALILATFFVVIFFLSNTSADLGARWRFPLGNLIGQRVLIDESAIRYFESCGMPLSEALMRLAGKFANAEERALYNDPELQAFRSWLFTDGKSCYMKWLISDPVYSLGETLNEFDKLITFPDVDRYFSTRFDPLMPVRVGKLLYFERFSIGIWIYITIAALIAVWKKLWQGNPLWAVFICLTLLVFPHLFLTWHGDAMAPERHALSVGVQLYLAFWLLNILLVDSFLRRRRTMPVKDREHHGAEQSGT